MKGIKSCRGCNYFGSNLGRNGEKQYELFYNSPTEEKALVQFRTCMG